MSVMSTLAELYQENQTKLELTRTAIQREHRKEILKQLYDDLTTYRVRERDLNKLLKENR